MHNRTSVHATERAACNDNAQCVCDRAQCAHERPGVVYCVVHCLGHCLEHCAWILFMDTVEKKMTSKNLGHHKWNQGCSRTRWATIVLVQEVSIAVISPITIQ